MVGVSDVGKSSLLNCIEVLIPSARNKNFHRISRPPMGFNSGSRRLGSIIIYWLTWLFGMPVGIACCSTSKKGDSSSLMGFCMFMTWPIRIRSSSWSSFTRRSRGRSQGNSCRWLSEIREISCLRRSAPTQKDCRATKPTISPANSEKGIDWSISTFRPSKIPAWQTASFS